jgi:hypothetical protein
MRGQPTGRTRADSPRSRRREDSVVSELSIDTALKQDDTGGFGFGGLDLDV